MKFEFYLGIFFLKKEIVTIPNIIITIEELIVVVFEVVVLFTVKLVDASFIVDEELDEVVLFGNIDNSIENKTVSEAELPKLSTTIIVRL